MGFGWTSTPFFVISPEEEGLLQFRSSAVLGSWVLFSFCGYLAHSGFGSAGDLGYPGSCDLFHT